MALAQFSPGPDMILLTRTALAEGAKRGAIMASGIATGLAVHTTLAVGGLALAIERMPALRKVVAWAAAGYLLWLAYRIAMEHFVAWYSGAKREETEARTGDPFIRGLLCNLLNPKVMVVLAAICAPFLQGPHPGWWPFALWAVVVVQGGILWSMWACLLQWTPLRTRYEKSSKWIDLTFALALTALAARMIFSA